MCYKTPENHETDKKHELKDKPAKKPSTESIPHHSSREPVAA